MNSNNNILERFKHKCATQWHYNGSIKSPLILRQRKRKEKELLTCLSDPPNTEEHFPLALLFNPPDTEEYTPLALLPAPPDTDESTPLALLRYPPITEERNPLASLFKPVTRTTPAPSNATLSFPPTTIACSLEILFSDPAMAEA